MVTASIEDRAVAKASNQQLTTNAGLGTISFCGLVLHALEVGDYGDHGVQHVIDFHSGRRPDFTGRPLTLAPLGERFGELHQLS